MPQLLRHCVDRCDDPAPRLGVRLESRQGAQGTRGEDCAGPRSEILGGEVFACDLSQVLVDIVGRHGALLTFGIDVLEEMLPRQLFTSLDHTCDPTVRDPDMYLTPTLAFE